MPTPDPNLSDNKRQRYPVGDLEHGQYVQNNKPLTIKDSPVEWLYDPSTQTISTGALALTNAEAGYNHALITVETAAVRFYLSGANPTSSVGHALEIGDTLELNTLEEIRDFRVIRRDAVDATLQVSYGRRS